MNEPTDINENDSYDDENLSSLYRRTSTEQPSKSVDTAILAKARKELENTTSNSQYYPGWSQSLSVAAVLVLSVTIILLVDKEQPVILEEPLPAMVAIQKQEHLPADRTLTRAPKRLEEENRQIQADIGEDNRSTFQLQGGETTVMSISPSPAKSKARKNLESPVIEPKAVEAETQISQYAPYPQASKALGITADSISEELSNDRSCHELSETECLKSAACTLTKNKQAQGYQCLPARDHCELMFRQIDGTREICESKQGCKFIPSNCYCPPNSLCACGGGEPALCKSADN